MLGATTIDIALVSRGIKAVGVRKVLKLSRICSLSVLENKFLKLVD